MGRQKRLRIFHGKSRRLLAAATAVVVVVAEVVVVVMVVQGGGRDFEGNEIGERQVQRKFLSANIRDRFSWKNKV